jgi:hypothetical protein
MDFKTKAAAGARRNENYGAAANSVNEAAAAKIMINVSKNMHERNQRIKELRKNVIKNYTHAINRSKATGNRRLESTLRKQVVNYNKETSRWNNKSARRARRNTRRNTRKN